MRFSRTAALLLLATLAATPVLAAQGSSALDPSVPPMRALIERFSADQATLLSVYADPLAPAARARNAAFYREQHALLATIDFNALDQEGKADYLSFANLLTQLEHQLALDERQWSEVAPLLPFAPAIFALEDARRRMERPDPQKAAAQLSELTLTVTASRKALGGAPPLIWNNSPHSFSTGSTSGTATIPPLPGGPRSLINRPPPRSRTSQLFSARNCPASPPTIKLQFSARPSAARRCSSSSTTP